MVKMNSDSTRQVWWNRTFQSQGFLQILREAEILAIPKHRKSEFQCYEKNMEKCKHSKIMDFFNILPEGEILTISKILGNWNPKVLENYGKTKIFQRMGFLHI